MSNSMINSIIDGKSSYAYAYMTRDHGYGHMTIDIRPAVLTEWGSRQNGIIKISCQVGGGGDFDDRAPYAIRYGMSTRDDVIQLDDIEPIAKMLKKIAKYLAKVESEMGRTYNYAEFCQRILLGSGVGALITEPDGGWVAGGRMSDKTLVTVGAASMRRLNQMQDNLIGAFSRKAA